MAHFYIDDTVDAFERGTTGLLSGSEGRHAATVSRLRVGESVRLGNGRGAVATVRVTATSRDSVEYSVETADNVPAREPRLVLAQALAKSDRDERAVEAAVEVGADVIIPWQAERSVSRWDTAKALKGEARWQTIAREASKQSMRAWVPSVESLSDGSRLVTRASSRLVVLDSTGIPIANAPWQDWARDGDDIVVIVGPEGGLTEQEIHLFSSAGADVLALGPHILRTSTAGPVALGIAATLMGRWG